VRRRRGGGGGLEGKKWSRSATATSAGSEAPGKSGNLCGGRPNANLLAVQRECGVAEDKKSDQWVFLAEAMALKYVLLELLSTFFLSFPRQWGEAASTYRQRMRY